MSYHYDFFISYAREDNADGFVGEFVERLVANPDSEKLFGAKPRVFFDQEAVRDMDDWESKVQAEADASRFLVVLLSPNYFQSELCAAEFARRLKNKNCSSPSDAGIAIVQIADVPGLFDEGAVDVPQKLRMRFPDWVAKVRGRQIADDYDLRDRAGAAVDRALAALCRNGRDRIDADRSEELDALNAALDECACSGVALMESDHAQAREQFEKALEASRQIVELTPDDPQALRDLSVSYHNSYCNHQAILFN